MMWSLFLLVSTYALPLDKLGAPPPPPTAPAMLVEQAQGTYYECTEKAQNQYCIEVGPKQQCLKYEGCGSDVQQCGELQKAGHCTSNKWMQQCCRPSCGLCNEPPLYEECSENEKSQVCMEWAGYGDCARYEDCGSNVQHCEVWKAGNHCDSPWLTQCCRVTCNICQECPPAETMTGDGCCPNDRVESAGEGCCPHGKKGTPNGCTALPAPPPPATTNGIDCGPDGNIGVKWTCDGCAPKHLGKICSAKVLGQSGLVQGVCSTDWTCV